MNNIEKKDLKNGDVFIAQGKLANYLNKEGTSYYLFLDKNNNIKGKVLNRRGYFIYNNVRMATPEEKHWLETCIKLDKFVEYGKAMKTFVKEIKIIEPLPYFKVVKLQNYDHKNGILEVENNEGNLFCKNDLITPIEGFNKGRSFRILSFRYNNNKTNICAVTSTHKPYGIGIDKIEHFIEKREPYIKFVSDDSFKACKEMLLNETVLEKDEEYILMNKACLSVNDIIENFLNIPNGNINDFAYNAIVKSLNQLANTKING